MNPLVAIPHRAASVRLRPAIMCLGLMGLLLSAGASAAPRTSASYTLTTETVVDGGGGRSTSGRYTNDGSVSEFGAAGTNTYKVRNGYAGQLSDALSLVVTATPDVVVEGATSQLSGVATLDDGTLTNLGGKDIRWTVVDGGIASISGTGLATADEVFLNAPATVLGTLNDASDTVTLAILNSNINQPGNTVPDPMFTQQSFAPVHAGLYQGLLRDIFGNVVGNISGFALKSTRAFTAKVVFNGVTYPLAGSFQPDGSFSGQILRPGKTPLAVNLILGVTGTGGLTINATVSGDGTTGRGFIAQAPYTVALPAPPALVKSYTFLVPTPITGTSLQPGGEGYGTAKVSTLGVITAAGKTGDGVAFTHSGYLTGDAQWHLFQSLYSGKGQIAGVLTFRDVPGVSDVDGALRWVKNPNPANKSYPLGFNLAPIFVGALYTPPAANQRALTQLADQANNARLTLASTVLAYGGVAKTLSWPKTNVLTYYGPETLSATVVASTGLISGSYSDPAIKVTIPFAGAVLQKQGLTGGAFLLGDLSGYLLVEPGINFPFPGSEGAGALARLTLPVNLATPPVLTPQAFIAGAAGSFGGILTKVPNISGGLENVTITSARALTGTVIIEGERFAFTGTIGLDGHALLSITRPGTTAIVGDLHLALANGTMDGFQLTGKFTIDGIDHSVDAQRFPVFTAAAPAPQTGKYTLAVAAPGAADPALEPGGDGYASLIIATTGAATGTLTLADGTTTTFANRVSRNGEWSFHRSLYGTSGGYLAGKLTFRDVAGVSDLDGKWRWVKPNAVAATPTYPAGFSLTRSVVGDVYTPPAANQLALSSLFDSPFNAWLRLAGPDMSSQAALVLLSVDRVVTWTPANKVLYYGADKATITVAAATGLVTGTYVDTPNGVNLSFGGAIMQKQGLVTGRYTAAGRTGFFSMVKR